MLGPLTIDSVARVHGFIGRDAPAHPHVSVIAASWQKPLTIGVPVVDRPIHSALYAVSLKRGDECHLAYGRQLHDAQAGTVVFLAPGQMFVAPEAPSLSGHGDAWTLVFHPALLEGTPLASRIRAYSFFGYAATEALHVSEDEQRALTDLVRHIDHVSSTDASAHDVLCAQLQLLFAYCERSYARQFRTRAGHTLPRLLRHLDDWFASPRPRTEGLPTVASCARALALSPDYLSDLLREETGANTREHIHRALIAAAQVRLASTTETISEIACALGFEHPQHFAKLFKQKAGCSPSAWRARRSVR